MEIKADGYITENGKLRIDQDFKPVFLEKISKNAGKKVVVTVNVEGKKRSVQQNHYYYGVVVGLVQEALLSEWGETLTKEEVHELLKQNCNWKEVVNSETGESIKIAQSTADLSTTEFEEYTERCRRFAAEYLGTSIPLPNEQINFEL